MPSVSQQSETLERATGELSAQPSALASSVPVPANSDATPVVPSACTVSIPVSEHTTQSPPLPLPLPLPVERERVRSRSRAPSVARRVIRKRIVHRYIPLLAAPAGRSPQQLQQQVLASQAAAMGFGFGRRLLVTQPAVLQQQPQPHQLSPPLSLDASHSPLRTLRTPAPGVGSALAHNLLVQRTFPNPIASALHRTAARPPLQTAPRCSRYSLVRNAAARGGGGSACEASTKYVYVPKHKTSLSLVPLVSYSGSSCSPLNAPAPAATSSSRQATCQMPAGPAGSMRDSSQPGCRSSAPLSSTVIPSLVRVSSGASYSAPQPEGVGSLLVIVSNATHSRYPTSADVAVSAEEANQLQLQQLQPPSVASSNVDASATGATARASPAPASGTGDTSEYRSTQYSHARQQRVHSAIASNSTRRGGDRAGASASVGGRDPAATARAVVASFSASGRRWRPTSHRWTAPLTHPEPLQCAARTEALISTRPAASAQVIDQETAAPLDKRLSDYRTPSAPPSSTSSSRFQWRRT